MIRSFFLICDIKISINEYPKIKMDSHKPNFENYKNIMNTG